MRRKHDSEENTAANLKPHSRAWFDALSAFNARQAAHTRQIVQMASHIQVCTVCGNKPASDYHLDGHDLPRLAVRTLACVRTASGFGRRKENRSCPCHRCAMSRTGSRRVRADDSSSQRIPNSHRSAQSSVMRVPVAPLRRRFRWKLARWSVPRLPTSPANAEIEPGSPASIAAKAFK